MMRRLGSSQGSNPYTNLNGSEQTRSPQEATPSGTAPSGAPTGLRTRPGLRQPQGLALRIAPPKLATRAEVAQQLNVGPITNAQLHAIANDFMRHAGMPVAITGSFALQLHAGKPLHRPINDIDFVVADLPQLKFSLNGSKVFDASNISEGEDNGWIIHRPTGQIFDVLQAGNRFGKLDTADVAGGLPVIPLNTLIRSMEARADKQDDLAFAHSLR